MLKDSMVNMAGEQQIESNSDNHASPTSRAGSAVRWQGLQHFGVKAIYLVRIPILARLLSPDDFGLMAIAIVAVSVLMQLTDFGFVPALVQRAETEEHHYHTAWTVGFLRAISVSIGVFFAAPLIAGFFSEPRADTIIRVLAIQPLFRSIASIRVADLTRNLQFRSIAVLNLSDAIVATTVSIAMAPFFGVWALVGGSIAGPFSYSILSYVLAPYRPRLTLERAAATSLIRFGRWIFVTGVVALVGNVALQAIISRKLGTVELGLYFLAAKIAFFPTEIALELVGGVAFPLYARMQSNLEQARQVFRTVFVGMSALLIPVLGLLVALAPPLVDEVLGPRWHGTAPLIRVIAAASSMGLLLTAAAPIFMGVGAPSRVTVFRTVQTAAVTISAWILAGEFGLVGAASAWIPAMGLGAIIGLSMLVRMFPGILSGLAIPVLSILCVSVIGGAVSMVVQAFIGGLGGFVAGGVLAGILMCVLLWSLDDRVELNLKLTIVKLLPEGARLARRREDATQEMPK